VVAAPGLRRTSRILLIDADGAALLFFTAAPDSSRFSRWITPGGGVDPGENHAQAAVRELFEETGLIVDTVGEPVWSLDFEVTWDEADHDRGHAEYYLVRCTRFEPASTNWTAEEHVDVTAHRWFTADELEASGEPFEPAELPDLLRRVVGLHA
jgi:8-oxo-dGTP pyrophosphatase MutT (NUDIX family)